MLEKINYVYICKHHKFQWQKCTENFEPAFFYDILMYIKTVICSCNCCEHLATRMRRLQGTYAVVGSGEWGEIPSMERTG